MSGGGLSKGTKLTKTVLAELEREQWFKLKLSDSDLNSQLVSAQRLLEEQNQQLEERYEIKKQKLAKRRRSGAGRTEDRKVYLAVKRRIQPGDKMAGRHGNKGVISVIMPVEDMPYDEHGEPIDIVLNPLGVPSRMNVGQILETHLGMAARGFGKKIDEMLEQQVKLTQLRSFLKQVYSHTTDARRSADIASLSDDELLALAENLRAGVPMATPVFDGAREESIKELLRMAELPDSGQLTLYDGRSPVINLIGRLPWATCTC